MKRSSKAAKAVRELVELDHGILHPRQARLFAEAFGLDPTTVPVHVIEHRPDEITGARLADCTRIGEKRYAIGADELAVWACQKLGLTYVPKMGRGAALRECCRVLAGHFGKKKS